MLLASASLPLLIVASAGVAVVHSIMPDHWVPLAIVARSNRWSLWRTAKVSLLAAVGHTVISVLLGLLVAAVGLAFRNAVIAQEGHVVGAMLLITGLGFLAFALWQKSHTGASHRHTHGAPGNRPGGAPGRSHAHAREASQEPAGLSGQAHGPRHGVDPSPAVPAPSGGSLVSQIIVPFGVAASPDLTVLPVFLAASATGFWPAVIVLVVFAIATLATFVLLTVGATIGGYQVEWPWLEANGHLVSAMLLIVIGVLAYLRL